MEPSQTLTAVDLLINTLIAIASLLMAAGALFLLRVFLRTRHHRAVSLTMSTLLIRVPKEKKDQPQQSGVPQSVEYLRQDIAVMETIFATVGGLRAQRGFLAWLHGREDHVSFEIVSRGGNIYFYCVVPRTLESLLIQQIHAQFPAAQIDREEDYNFFSPKSSILGAYVTMTREFPFAIKTFRELDSDPLSGLTNPLAKIGKNDGAAIQFVVRSSKKTWRKRAKAIIKLIQKGKYLTQHNDGIGSITSVASAMISGNKQEQSPKDYHMTASEDEMVKRIDSKMAKAGLDVNIRVIVAAENDHSARQYLDTIVSAFGQFNNYSYGNSFKALVPRMQSTVIEDFIYRAFAPRRRLVLNTEEMASLWHLPLPTIETPNIVWLGARKAAPPQNMPKEGLILGRVTFRGEESEVRIKRSDRRRHLYTIGKSGSGKSVFLENMAIQDINNGEGVCVVDPHGDLVQHILANIPEHRIDDVIYFCPSDLDRPIGLNMLEARSEDQKDFVVQEMIAIFYKLFPPEMIGPMFEHQMRNVMLTLMADVENPGTIAEIPRMFSDEAYAKTWIAKLKDPVVRSFWEKEMAKTSDFHKSEMLGYLVSKVGRFVENEMLRNIIGQSRSGFDFREVMDNKKILLVNLSKGTTGEVNAKLLGLIIVAKLQMAALTRADLPEDQRHDFYLYIDEFQNFITDSIATILSEARKYRLNLTIAHQYMGQLVDGGKNDTSIRDAVLGNVGTMAAFRIGPEDAELLQKEFAPVFSAYDLINVEQYTAYVKLLIDNTAAKPFNMATTAPLPENNEYAEMLKQLSRLKFGRDRATVEEDILERSQLGTLTLPAQPLTEAKL